MTRDDGNSGDRRPPTRFGGRRFRRGSTPTPGDSSAEPPSSSDPSSGRSSGRSFGRRRPGPVFSSAPLGSLPEDENPELRDGAAGDGEGRLESRRPRKKARDKVMDLLARRLHSAHELKQKLKPYYDEAEIDDAIQFAQDNKWMLPPEELATRVSAELGRRKKGHRYINQFLHKKGLPSVEKVVDDEVEKALAVIENKAERIGRGAASGLAGSSFGHPDDDDVVADEEADAAPLDYQAKRARYVQAGKDLQKLQRALISRGFDHETIRKALDLWKQRSPSGMK